MARFIITEPFKSQRKIFSHYDAAGQPQLKVLFISFLI